MLNIYVGKENLPPGKKFYYDAQALAPRLDLTRDSVTADILKDIEQAVPQTKETYIDRFGRGLYSSTLSTSTIILLSVHQLEDIVVNGDEMGENAFGYLNNLKSGNIYFSTGLRDIDEMNTPLSINGKVCETEEELWEAYMEV